MLNLIKVNRPIKVDGVEYASSQAAYEQLKQQEGQITIVIPPASNNQEKQAKKRDLLETYKRMTGEQLEFDLPEKQAIYRIKVKKYMTEKSSPGFDFMRQWNNNNPMPLVIMKGKILEETKGMYKMELFATPEPSTHCLKCGRELKHPVSVLYGIGPECGGHFHINPFNSEQELQQHWEELKEKMSKLKWTGWVIKSAIKEMTLLEE